jgi:4-hydroxyphenylpyruvate dioxygenase
VAQDRGLEFLTVPDNYYGLVARFDLAPNTVAQLHELGLLYNREAGGELVHFYTATCGRTRSRSRTPNASTLEMGNVG